MNCPIIGCSESLIEHRPSAEKTGPHGWFWGSYICPVHGRLRVAGTLRHGEYSVTHWHPQCPQHGLDPVVRLLGEEFDSHTFRCLAPGCHREFSIIDGIIAEVRWMRHPEPLSMETFAAELAGVH